MGPQGGEHARQVGPGSAAGPQAPEGSAVSRPSPPWGGGARLARVPALRSSGAPRGPSRAPEVGAGLGRGCGTRSASLWGSARTRRLRGPWAKGPLMRGQKFKAPGGREGTAPGQHRALAPSTQILPAPPSGASSRRRGGSRCGRVGALCQAGPELRKWAPGS